MPPPPPLVSTKIASLAMRKKLTCPKPGRADVWVLCDDSAFHIISLQGKKGGKGVLPGTMDRPQAIYDGFRYARVTRAWES